jgi:hypothetical protein
VTASWDKTARLWDLATPAELARQVKESNAAAAKISSTVPQVAMTQMDSLSLIASGLQFSDDGSLVAVDEERRLQLTRQLKDQAPDSRANPRFIDWFFSTGSNQTIFPANNLKVVEWVDSALLTNPNLTEGWLRKALVFLPDHALLHIALAGLETDPKRADFLRSFGLARLPKNSVVCKRASEMLLAQDSLNLALAAINKALIIDPSDLSAQRLQVRVIDAMSK